MAILDIFKRKTALKGSEPRPARAGREAKKPVVPKAQPKPARPRMTARQAYRVLKEPHVAEKATDLTSINQYVFKVLPRANKPEIKKTVEELYGVSVVSVRIITVHHKKRRLGKIEGWRQSYKKAIVKIKEGQKIEVLPR